jgi:hypothetical protein
MTKPSWLLQHQPGRRPFGPCHINKPVRSFAHGGGAVTIAENAATQPTRTG